MKKILLVFAHPDDETISSGGTVAKYVKAGWQVDLVCATKGEAGDELGKLRELELKKAADILGISVITSLGYNDGRLKELTPGTLEDPIYRALESGLPDVVITFDQTGINNHPDHIKICFAVTYAFQKYALWLAGLRKKYRVFGTRDEQWLKRLETMMSKRFEPKLYYACLPETVVKYLQKVNALPKESFGKSWIGVPDRLITTIIDIGKHKNVKMQALGEHRSQLEDFEEEIALTNNPEFLKEFYILRMQGTEEIFLGKNDPVRDRL